MIRLLAIALLLLTTTSCWRSVFRGNTSEICDVHRTGSCGRPRFETCDCSGIKRRPGAGEGFFDQGDAPCITALTVCDGKVTRAHVVAKACAPTDAGYSECR